MNSKINKTRVVFSLFAALLMFSAGAWAENGTFTTNRHWKQVWERFSAVAGEDLTIGDPIALNRYNGKAYKADADDADRRPCVGLAGFSVSSGDDVEIVRRGVLSGLPCGLGTESSSCVTPIGTPLVLSIVQGGVTLPSVTAASGVSQWVGYAGPLSPQAVRSGVTTGTDTYIVDITPPEHRNSASYWY